ncbi:hypothetical protein H6768_02735 [Candidatus Peribacteria bacterium]|nr:hypothetical protein [Candidatus Peribacteria bacterium]
MRVSIDRCEAKIDAPTCKFKQKEPYCTDNKANNQETLAQCNARIDQTKQECVSDNTSCTYNELYYCTDKNALNYDPTGSQCKASIKDPTKQKCTADNKSCIYDGTNATLCLQQVNGQPVTFTTMPDFSNMVSFNAFFKICSNNGIYVYT